LAKTIQMPVKIFHGKHFPLKQRLFTILLGYNMSTGKEGSCWFLRCFAGWFEMFPGQFNRV
jgi:hypothetical protein